MHIKARSSLIESLWISSATDRHTSGAHFVSRFETLTGLAVRSATVAAIPRSFLGLTVEPPEELARRYCYELQPRTYNALRRHGGDSRQSWTFGRLLNIRGFGLYSLLDLLEVRAKHSPSDGEQPRTG